MTRRITLRPFHIWWLGVLVFTPSVFLWLTMFTIFGWNGKLAWLHLNGIWRPCLAALLGFGVPIVFLRYLGRSSTRLWCPIFLAYCVILLTWGLIEIRNEEYQMGYYRCPTGVHSISTGGLSCATRALNRAPVEGHWHYFHDYYTWYFLPYRWIEKGVDDL